MELKKSKGVLFFEKSYPPEKLTYPLKINGWKDEFPFGALNGLFSGPMLIFEGVPPIISEKYRCQA